MVRAQIQLTERQAPTLVLDEVQRSRDLQALRAVENLADFRRLMRAACLRIGGILNPAAGKRSGCTPGESSASAR